MKFDKNFLFGVATSAAQVEGAALEDGRGLSIWDTFARIPGAIADGSLPDPTCDMYHHWKSDIQLMKELNIESYRFSFSWSRILPDGKGRINEKGLDYYKRMIDELHKQGIVPNATIYHWDLPYELEREGGWLNRDIVNWYGEYASLLFKEFGDSVPIWATINEPVATYVGYAMGFFAPGYKNEKYGRQVNHHILFAHGEGVQRFREAGLKDAKIGIVVDIWNHHPLRPDNEEDQRLAEMENEKTYRSYLNPIFRGCYSDKLLHYMEENHCMPQMEPGDMEKISRKIDFFGLNCYNRVVDCADPDLLQNRKREILGGNYLDDGTEFYPKAVYDAAHILHDEYKLDIPIYVTENGLANCKQQVEEDGSIHDTERIQYLNGFLEWIEKAINDGIDIRGYYVWSLLDNWEWCGGHKARYGLVHVDFDTQQRTCKDSAVWYKNKIAEVKKDS